MRNFLLIVFIVVIHSCKEKVVKPAIRIVNTTKIKTASHIRMQGAPELFITGDFDGDGESDTLTQIIKSGVSHKKMDSMPSQYYNEWDSIVQFGNKWDTHVCLTSSLDRLDTLDIGQGMGLYCLINLGQLINRQDIIAFVPNYYDFSNLNTCRIYALEGKHWKYLTGFSINEMAFTWKTDTIPIFRNIPGYLKKEKLTWLFRNNEWDYTDYNGNSSQFRNLKNYLISQLKLNKF